MKSINLEALMASSRQCGVAFVVAGLVHGFLGSGPAGEAFVSGCFGLALVLIGSIQLSGGKAK